MMPGRAREATELMGDIRQYAASTPFNNRDITDATRRATFKFVRGKHLDVLNNVFGRNLGTEGIAAGGRSGNGCGWRLRGRGCRRLTRGE